MTAHNPEAAPARAERDPRYDILFEPVKIGPVTAKNRFYQVPHCTGSGWQHPRTLAALRGMKAEGGWAVVSTEYCSVHPTSDDQPHPSATMWDDGDVRSHAMMTDAVHAHGALAAVELFLGGARTANLLTRETPFGASSVATTSGHPFQTRAMDKSDIREARRWHREAVLRSKRAGFDIVYVYATHGYLLSQFLSPTYNTRIDEYGGSLENRLRLTREIIEDTKEAVGDSMAVAVRFSAETNGGDGGDGNPVPGETAEIMSMIGELPDLWDINVSDYSLEMGVSRFVPQGSLEPYVAAIKSMTTKPVVSVGRFTSPDMMASMVKRGVVDMIGAARPSIADPFLPKKIEEGRIEDIRECIGCNICYTGDGIGVPIRCTQNPTMSEEWRRGWHPEQMGSAGSDSSVLIVGAGPAGLEAAHVLGKRGYAVMLAEATRELGGRVRLEAGLPGLSEWIRVRDYRLQQLEKLPNVEIFRESEMTAETVLEVAPDHVAIATGGTWRRDGRGLTNPAGIAALSGDAAIHTPDDILQGTVPDGPVVVFDDDHYYMGSAIAEKLSASGIPVTLVTPEDAISVWGEYTYERWRVQERLMELGVDIVVGRNLAGFTGQEVLLTCEYTDRETTLPAASLVLVTSRSPNDALAIDLQKCRDAGETSMTVTQIGDCNAPSIIAAAVHAGHQYGRTLDIKVDPDNPMKHDRVFFEEA